MTTIAGLPAAPNANSGATVAADSDAFFGGLPTYGSQLTAVATETNATKLAAAGYGGGKAEKVAVSSSNHGLGGGIAVFNVGLGKTFLVGETLVAVSGANYLIGVVTDYTGGTLTMNELGVVGSGTFSAWVISYKDDTALGAYLNVASAAVVDLRDIGNAVVTITGTTTISSFLLNSGQTVVALLASSLTIAYNPSSYNLQGNAPYFGYGGDMLQLSKDSTGTVYVSISRTMGGDLPVKGSRAVFGYGSVGASSWVSMTNLVSNLGVVATDTTGVGSARASLAAAGYGGDRVIFGYGDTGVSVSLVNLVANTGVVAADTTGVGTARQGLAAAGYSVGRAIFAYGYSQSIPAALSMSNLVSTMGVVSTDTAGVGTIRWLTSAAGYGGDKAIVGYGGSYNTTPMSLTNLIANTGVVSADVTGVGTARYSLAATGYGSDGKALFGFGTTPSRVSITNHVANTGVVSTDITGVGTARHTLAATGYGGTKAMFGYGHSVSGYVSMVNLVSDTGVVSTDTTGVGTVRNGLAAASLSGA